jgi:hypothetical protein
VDDADDVMILLGYALCGGVGLFENMDMVENERRVVELVSLCHGLVDPDADVNTESLANLACFDSEGAWGYGCDGTVRFGLFGLGICGCEETLRLGDGWAEAESDVQATGSFEVLLPLHQRGSLKQECFMRGRACSVRT